MKVGTRVLICCTNLPGTILYRGEGEVKEVRNHNTHQEYIVKCNDGMSRSVTVGDRSHAKDEICLM